MRIGLLNSFNQDGWYEAELPPLGLGYLAAWLKKYHDINDIVFEKKIDDLAQHKPDIVGISSVAEYYGTAVEQANFIKETLNAPVLVGGAFITAMPEALASCFDVGVLGEGEVTFAELMLAFRDGNWGPATWKNIDGICYRDTDGNVQITKARQQIEYLDSIPFPDRDLLGDHWKIPFEQCMYIVSSRGCAFSCRFCSSQMHFSGPRRFFSADYVAREIRHLVERYGTRSISFWDDIFVVQKSRLESIARQVRQANIHQQVAFHCHTRANIVDAERLELMRIMNITACSFGAESGSDRVLQYLKGGKLTAEQNQAAIDLLFNYGIKPGCSLLIGSPIETEEETRMTLDFVKRNSEKLLTAEFFPCVAFPGTEIFREALTAGKITLPITNFRQFTLSPQEMGEKFWENYVFINDQMSLETFKILFYQAREISLMLNIKREQNRIGELEQAVHQLAREREQLSILRNSRSLRGLEKMITIKNRIFKGQPKNGTNGNGAKIKKA